MPLGSYGGSSDPQARGSERVRSRKISATDYDVQKVPPGQFGSPEAEEWVRKVQQSNSNRAEDDDLATWAQGQVKNWQDYVQRSKGQTDIDLNRWLSINYAAEKAGIGQYGGSADFLEQLDAQRADAAKQNMDEADRKRAALEVPKTTPSQIERGPLVTKPYDDPEFMRDGDAIATFKAEVGPMRGLDSFIRSELAAYRRYVGMVGRKNTSLTFKSWLQANFRAARDGGTR